MMLLLLAVLAGVAHGQTPAFTYSYRPATGSTTTTVQPNGMITLPAITRGSTSSVVLSITNGSTVAWRLLDTAIQGVGFTGSASNVTIAPGATYSFGLSFAAQTAGQFNAFFTVRYVAVTSGFATLSTFSLECSVSNPTIPGVDNSPIVVSYVFQDRGNYVPLNAGDGIAYPATSAGTRNAAAIVITNRGSVTATINSVTVSGTGFELAALPLLPLQVIAGGETRFNLVFAPVEGRQYSGELRVTVAGAAARSFPLTGQGASPQLSYELIGESGSATLSPGTTIVFPSVLSGSGASLVRVRVRNSGNAVSPIIAFSMSGSAFALLDQPAPGTTIAANSELTVRIQFTPPDVGDYSGQLRIDTASFPLTGHGSGARLTAWMGVGEDRVRLRAETRGVIPNTDVGAVRQFVIEVVNSGDASAPIAAIQLSGEGFSLQRIPLLPLRIAAGDSLLLTGAFSPTLTGSTIGFLTIQDQSYQLLGVGSDPPPLPAVKFVGLPESPQALQQPAVGLELASPYPNDLTGTLRMSFTSEAYLDDPAIQFLNGQRTIDFRIPANSTRAVFGLSAQQILMQTGSLAGAITLTAQINTGKYDLTRSTPPVAVLNIPPGAPVIRTVEFVALASKRFQLVITGAATSRAVTKFSFQFTAKPGTKLQASSLASDVTRAFETWYQSANSRPFGGQFRAVVVFDLTTDYGALDSIQITATNGLGTSTPKVVKVSAGN